jgi:hypothetical protein
MAETGMDEGFSSWHVFPQIKVRLTIVLEVAQVASHVERHLANTKTD